MNYKFTFELDTGYRSTFCIKSRNYSTALKQAIDKAKFALKQNKTIQHIVFIDSCRVNRSFSTTNPGKRTIRSGENLGAYIIEMLITQDDI